MSTRIDKDSMPCNKPRRTPGHPEKSHVVKACYSGKQKVIRFGEQGASTAGKPKAGESERMTKKRASFKARHAKNIAKGPESAAYWANKVKWADGGAVNLKEGGALNRVRKQREPEPSFWDYAKSVGSTLTSLPSVPGALWDIGERAVKATPQAVRSGLQYVRSHTPREVGGDIVRTAKGIGSYVKEHPVSTALDVVPIVGDIKAYGEDVRDAARRRALGDLAGAYKIEQMALPLAIASIAPGVGEARKAGKVARIADEATDVARAGTKIMKRPASFPVDFGRPKGNINLRPSIDPVTLKGAEVQDVESLINQLKGRPGVTKQGLERVAAQFEPGERVSLAEFGKRLPQSEYSTTDLMKAVDDADEHLYQEAMNMVNQDRGEVFGRIAEEAGLNWHDGRFIQDIYDNGYDPLDLDHVSIAENLKAYSPASTNLEDLIGDLYQDHYNDAVDMTAEQLRDYMEPGDFNDYTYRDYQRLVPEDMHSNPGYFELGVTHPEMTDKYRHYPNAENLAGHIRGTFNPKNLLSGATHYGSNFSSPATVEELLGGSAQRAYTFRPKPNSMVIEELQSDAAKNLGDTGALHQIHGTLFKGAVQHALENGADTIYLPTAKAVGLARFTNPDDYRSIYDKEVIKYGLNPLSEIPGVQVNPIDDVYHEITVSPEARERIIRGAGQKTPGFADGGLVSSYDEAKVADLADQIREGIYG